MTSPTAPVLHNLAVGDLVRATVDGPWWSGRILRLVDLRCDGDVATVRPVGLFDDYAPEVSVPSSLLTPA